jgi:hypothetical protein
LSRIILRLFNTLPYFPIIFIDADKLRGDARFQTILMCFSINRWLITNNTFLVFD